MKSHWQRLAQELKPGFDRLELLLARLGHPEERLPLLIQVAGTHGKSSVTLFLEAVFQAAGLRVGVCASPDFSDPTEALRLEGQSVSPLVASTLLAAALEPWEEFVFGPGKPTVHEALVAVGLAHFVEAGADLIILEASSDRRWDPTNFFRPQLSLLTSLQAQSPVGLVRPGVPLVTTVEEEGLVMLAQACRQSGAALVLVDPTDVELLELRWDRAIWRSQSDPLDLGPFETRFAAAYQAANLSLVLAALAELFGGVPLSQEAVRKGLAQAYLPGRFELVHAEPWIVLDAAQDEGAAQALLRSLERLPPLPGRQTLLLAHPRGDLGQRMERILGPKFHRVFSVPPVELPLRLPQVLRGLAAGDFLLVVGPPIVLREATDVILKSS